MASFLSFLTSTAKYQMTLNGTLDDILGNLTIYKKHITALTGNSNMEIIFDSTINFNAIKVILSNHTIQLLTCPTVPNFSEIVQLMQQLGHTCNAVTFKGGQGVSTMKLLTSSSVICRSMDTLVVHNGHINSTFMASSLYQPKHLELHHTHFGEGSEYFLSRNYKNENSLTFNQCDIVSVEDQNASNNSVATLNLPNSRLDTLHPIIPPGGFAVNTTTIYLTVNCNNDAHYYIVSDDGSKIDKVDEALFDTRQKASANHDVEMNLKVASLKTFVLKEPNSRMSFTIAIEEDEETEKASTDRNS